ncbi:MAG: mechanosensitive ion channel, partial [Chitinophagaceae bacterium]
LTTSDYQLQIEKMFLSLSNIENNSHLGPSVNNLKRMLDESSEVLGVLKKNVDKNNTALNIKNLQVFRSLLQNIQKDLRDERVLLDSNEKKLNKLRTDLRVLVTDSILKQVMRTDTLRTQFASQLRDLRRAFFSSSRGMKESMNTINFLQTQTSSNSIITNQLLEDINNLLSSSAIRIFGKEYNYLWERDTVTVSAQTRRSFDEVYEGETKAINYYFSDNGYKMFLLLLIGALFYYWVRKNMRFLRTRQNTHELTLRDFEYLRYGVLPATFIVVFSVAPIFDLHAPAAYIETMQLFLLIAVTYVMYRKWPKKIFGYWILIGILFIVFSLTSHNIDPGFLERWFLVILNVASIIAAWLFIKAVKDTHHLKRFLGWVLGLHIFLNFLSIVFNIFGRYTLAQILGNAAIFAVSQALGLAIFSKVWLEAILAQMVSSRLRHGFDSNYEFRQVLKSFSRPIKFLVVVLWFIVLTTNLNLYSFTFNIVTSILQAERTIGSATFTLGGIALFFMIIWIAHLLQRYIGYFFGDTGDDEEMQSKGQRSRLLIARLVLLCIGYLLAVAASGIPVDKITIVLGALGVGIGLGLQNIVSNFVSGIILIFDRPLQIGDIVEIGDKQGKVREIGLRSSTILTQDGAEVIIPNGDLLSRQIVNWTLTTNQRRITFALTVSGSDDMELVSSVIKAAILRSDYIAKMRDPQILITKVNENGFELQAFCWCIDAANYEVAKSQINLLLAEEMGKRGLTF